MGDVTEELPPDWAFLSWIGAKALIPEGLEAEGRPRRRLVGHRWGRILQVGKLCVFRFSGGSDRSLPVAASMRRTAFVKRGSGIASAFGMFDRASIRTLGGVGFSTRCSMMFDPNGAARSAPASQACRDSAVAVNSVCPVHCCCSELFAGLCDFLLRSTAFVSYCYALRACVLRARSVVR